MRILHICLASNYTEGMTYQDNLLPLQNALDGHDVCIIADCSTYKDGKVVQTEPCDYVLSSGIRLIRLPLIRLWPRFLTYKLRITPQLKKTINKFQPDVILYHGLVGISLLTVGNYIHSNKNVKFYVDSHEDAHNSGLNWISKWIQYKLITRSILSLVRKKVDKVLYISIETADFLKEHYKLQDDEMEFYPLGGYIIEPKQKKSWRDDIRNYYALDKNNIILVHTGKLVSEKRTVELLRAFSKNTDPRLRLIIAGSIPENEEKNLLSLINNDNRIIYIGWVDGDTLTKLLCAADCYMQPGTQSATLQVALCCGLPIVVYPYTSHKPYIDDNGFFSSSEEELSNIIN
ncbi:glycosyltransferase family 4 protein, partial [Xenorhabdus sp. PB30.3]|uniref:glycosyltransferase family 4 protein n=1 Tax=Xenorhabdus sp. PB30.3 TaxID=2788941 RepID=UPI001E459DBA